eukprot:symbB.v1.2.040377.t1/scaffold7182.1/size12851/1
MLVSVLLWAVLAPGHSIAFNNFNNRAELRAAVVAWEKDVTERSRLTSLYGLISEWDVSHVTNM